MNRPEQVKKSSRPIKVAVAVAALLLVLASLGTIPRTESFFTHNTQSESYTVQFNGN